MAKPIALVTGGSRGIGRAIVTELVRSHHVLATFNTNQLAAENVSAETGASFIPCNLNDAFSRTHLLEQVFLQVPRVDLLVNNAGIAPRRRIDVLEATEESFDEVVGTNLKGPYFLTQQIAKHMLQNGSGRIVFVTSVSSFTASTSRGEYCLSKAGLSMAAKLFATRLAPHNIPVFEIQPGIIRTDMIEAVTALYEQRIADGLLPQRRMGEGRDVASVIRAIADGLLDYSTGQVIHVDGGFHLRTL